MKPIIIKYIIMNGIIEKVGGIIWAKREAAPDLFVIQQRERSLKRKLTGGTNVIFRFISGVQGIKYLMGLIKVTLFNFALRFLAQLARENRHLLHYHGALVRRSAVAYWHRRTGAPAPGPRGPGPGPRRDSLPRRVNRVESFTETYIMRRKIFQVSRRPLAGP